MKAAQESISYELAVQLDKLGRERGGRVVCLAVVTRSDIQLMYPGLASPEVIARVEEAVIGAMIETMDSQ